MFYKRKVRLVLFYSLDSNYFFFYFAENCLSQQIDFLETIFEETSEDLQSDSDRSDGTTCWLGSDSETESVIHITINKTAGENKFFIREKN